MTDNTAAEASMPSSLAAASGTKNINQRKPKAPRAAIRKSRRRPKVALFDWLLKSIFLSRHRHHIQAGVYTLAASLGATAKVIGIVFDAFFPAGLADHCAQLSDVLDEMGAGGHEAYCHARQAGALFQKVKTIGRYLVIRRNA
jgi:hypothetical protein